MLITSVFGESIELAIDEIITITIPARIIAPIMQASTIFPAFPLLFLGALCVGIFA